MRSTLPRFVVWVGAIGMIGAGSCGDLVSPAASDLPEPGDTIIVAFDASLDPWPRDPWGLMEATVAADSLHLEVGFAGGCREHHFWLLAVDGFRTLPDAGPTSTVAVPLVLAHDSHGDSCEAYLTRNLVFGLGPLRQAFHAQVSTGAGRVLLRIPTGQGTSDSTTVDFAIP